MRRAVDLEQTGSPVCRQSCTESHVTVPAKESGIPEHPHRHPSVVRTPWKDLDALKQTRNALVAMQKANPACFQVQINSFSWT